MTPVTLTVRIKLLVSTGKNRVRYKTHKERSDREREGREVEGKPNGLSHRVCITINSERKEEETYSLLNQ